MRFPSSILLMVALVSGFLIGTSQCQDPAREPFRDGATPAVQGLTVPVVAAPSMRSSDSKLLTDKDSRNLPLGSGDVVEMTVFGVPELTKQMRINTDGDMSAPILGLVHLAGLTSEEAERLLERSYGERNYLKNPHISLFVKEFVTQGISILGEVARPGIYSLLGPRTLFNAISAAGGTTAEAGRTVSITHRNAPDNPVSVLLSAEQL